MAIPVHRQALFLSSPVPNFKRGAITFDAQQSANQLHHHISLERKHHGKRSTQSPITTRRSSATDFHITQTIQKRQSFFFDPAFHPRSTRTIADEANFLLRTKAITGKIIHNCAQVQFDMQQQLLTQTLHRLINRAAIFIAKFFFIRMIFFLTILQPVTMKSSSRDGQKQF